MGIQLSAWVENIVGKGEIARYEQFLLSTQCFRKQSVVDVLKRWHGKHTFLSSLGMLGITQLKSILFADHITFSYAYLKRVHTRQRMTNNNNNNKRKQV